MEKRVICIVGPTASGKTAVGVQLAKRLGTEIVSADSVQVYRGMDIGSAKPDEEERDGVVHHMIDCVPIDNPDFSVSKYASMAFPILDDMLSRGQVPLVVGGSGLYISSITDPLRFAIPADPAIRKTLEQEYGANPALLFEELRQVDERTAHRLNPNDAKRVIRALEVYRCCGKPLSSFGNDFRNSEGRLPPYKAQLFGLRMERPLLYERIERRVERMMACGLLEEARAIYDKDYDRRLPAMQSIGYRQLFAFFDGVSTLEEAVESIKQETRRFAKRQMTWFRRDSRIQWVSADEKSTQEITEEILVLLDRQGQE